MTATRRRTINPIAAMFDGAQTLLCSELRAQFEANISAVADHPRIDDLLAVSSSFDMDDFWPETDEDWRASLRPYVVQNGILHLPVRGTLLHNFPWQLGNWATGYEYIERAFMRGMDDANVQGIALVMHSGGGIVAGNQLLVDRMFARRGEKPIRAFAHEAAYSAAYNIASVADQIVVSQTGGVGSIGVRTTHVDWTKFNEEMGLKYTFIFAGEGKTDGDPDEELSAEAKARIQVRIDELYEVFVSSVARNRGIEADTIRGDLKAHCYTATQALSNGLADSIGPLDDALSAFADDLSSSEGDEEMSTPDKSAVDQAAIDAAVAAARSEEQSKTALAATEAVAADRERQKAITGSDEAKGRESLASHIALNTNMSAEDAKSMLAAAPLAVAAPVAAATETPFDAAASKDNPEVGADAPKGEAAADSAAADEVLALVRGAGVVGFAAPAKN